MTHPQVRPDPAFGLLKLYDDALPHVYGYLLARCGDTGLAEDLTAESFLAAVHAVRKPGAAEPSIPALAPYIVVSDARRAMGWYAEVFGARLRDEPYVNADGTIGHAEVGIGDAVLMFAEASDLWPDVPVRAPEDPTTFSHTLHLEVDDVDGITERARRSGASVEREPVDQPYGRGSVIVDPFGHRWMLLRPPAQAGLADPGAARQADPGGARQADPGAARQADPGPLAAGRLTPALRAGSTGRW